MKKFYFKWKGSRDNWRIPLLCVLCTHKTKSTYETIFQKIKSDLPQYSPIQINVDFELAAIKAISEIYPNTKIQGCYFHLKQSVVRNLGTNGLKSRYEEDIKFAKEIRQMIGTAFLPPDEVKKVRNNYIFKCDIRDAPILLYGGDRGTLRPFFWSALARHRLFILKKN